MTGSPCLRKNILWRELIAAVARCNGSGSASVWQSLLHITDITCYTIQNISCHFFENFRIAPVRHGIVPSS
jgi:hypothetical protein